MRKSKQLIPKGYYCYDERGICPYWHCDEARPAQQNGYCAYMGKGDWDLNKKRDGEKRVVTNGKVPRK